MRVRVIFDLNNKGATVPFHHQFLIAQIVRGVLVKGGDSCFKKYQFFNFSGLKGQTRVGRNGLHYFSKKVTIVFSSPNESFVNYFLKNLFDQSTIQVGNLLLSPDTVDREITPSFGTSSKFICISPLVIVPAVYSNEENKEFIAPSDPTFSARLVESTQRKLQQFKDTVPADIGLEDFDLIPDHDYLAKIRAGQKKFSRIYPLYDDDVKYEVRGYTFPFTLDASPELFEFLFNCGFGEYGHKGFGMLDIGSPAYSREIEPYNFKTD